MGIEGIGVAIYVAQGEVGNSLISLTVKEKNERISN